MNDVDPSLMMEDMDAALGTILKIAAGVIGDIKPTDKTADFDVEFELADMEINGKAKKVWVPKDANEFGELISTTAIGG